MWLPRSQKEDVGGADPHPGAGIYLHRWHGCSDLIRKSAGGHAVLRSGHLGIILGGACPSDLRGLYWKRRTKAGAVGAFFTGLICSVLFWKMDLQIYWAFPATLRSGGLCCDPDVLRRREGRRMRRKEKQLFRSWFCRIEHEIMLPFVTVGILVVCAFCAISVYNGYTEKLKDRKEYARTTIRRHGGGYLLSAGKTE